MGNFDPYNVLLSIATNIPVLLMTAFVLQAHKYKCSLSDFTRRLKMAKCKMEAAVGGLPVTEANTKAALHTRKDGAL